MNIKLKAFLIVLAMLSIAFGFICLLVIYPLAICIITIIGMSYAIYCIALDILKDYEND